MGPAVAIPIALSVAQMMMNRNASKGGTSGISKDLLKYSTSPYESKTMQEMLPPALGMANINPMMTAGMQRISAMLQTPGKLSGGVSGAVLPGQAMQSDALARTFQQAMANRAGALGNANLPSNIKAALMSALGGGQEAGQRGVRGEAYGASENLQRQDVQNTYKMLDAILQYISSARGQAIQGLGGAAQIDQANSAARTAQYGAMIQGLAQALSGIGNKTSSPAAQQPWYGDTLM